MSNTKKYEIPEEEPLMVSEPTVAVPVEMVQQKMPTIEFDIQEDNEWIEDFSVPSLQRPVEELKERIEKGIEEYHQGVYYTQEEVEVLMNHWTKNL